MVKVSDVIVDTLIKLGVKRVYGIPGDTIAPFLDSIKKSGKITFIQVRHEEYGAIAAEYEWRISSQLAVCTATSGPGVANLISGLYDAKMDHVPVLAITGLVETKNLWRGYTQELNSLKLFDDVSVFNSLLINSNEAEYIIYKAYNIALNKKGVSHVAVPLDVFMSEGSQEGYANVEIVKPVQEFRIDVNKAVEIIQESERPVIIIGGGAIGEGDRVATLAKKISAPILFSLNGKGIVSEDEEFIIGGIGLMGNYASYYAISNADLILALGTSLPFREYIPKDAKVIQVDIDPLALNDKFRVDLAYNVPLKYFLDAILDNIKGKEKSNFLREVLSYKKRWEEYSRKVEDENLNPIKPQRVISSLSRNLMDGDVVVVDAGSSTAWVSRHFKVNKNIKIVFTSWLGMMGVSIPGVLAGSFLNRKRVIGIAGDGAFSMSMMELLTLKKYNSNGKVIVLNNGVYGTVKYEQEKLGFESFGIELSEANFSKVAEAMGITGIRIEDVRELDEKIVKFLNVKGPAVLEVLVDPNEIPIPWNVIPPT
ncbi:MAG: pyruvate oxidase [Sulfolobus sp.]|nr:pyruvate oxidase [Sulfolobus sp.]